MIPPDAPERLDAFFYEAFAEEAERLHHHAAGAGLRIGTTAHTIQESGHSAPPSSVISIRTQSVPPAAWAGHLKGLLSRSTGYDHLLTCRAAMDGNGPPLGYLPLYCARAVAEQALLLWTALLRRLPRQLTQFERFHRDHLTGRENAGQTLAIWGVGHIGHEIWRIATALGLNAVGVDPVHRHADVTYVSPEEALEQADILVCAMNLTPRNRGYFSTERLAETRRKPLLVNIARGEFTPAAALETALDHGWLSGVALDVYNEETSLAAALRAGQSDALTPDNQALLRLRQHANVLLTPHNAFNTAEAVERKSEQSIRTLLHFRQTGVFLWPVPEE
ncbi:MAG: NAD(P)-dependent oxidoreductase [Kiritimatiellae bacterium]|nr:NAD(P)-dependent oxidoreductase [Kiritimatiellia bacterium]